MPVTRRGRRPKACDSCSKRKIQCDRESPQCNWCKHHDAPCTNERLAEKNGARSNNQKDQVASLAPRTGSLSNVGLETGMAPDNVNATSPQEDHGDLPADHSARSHSSYFYMNLLNGLPLMSNEAQYWIESRAGERVADETLRALQLPWQTRNRKFEMDRRPDSRSELPDRLRVEQYTLKYCSSFEYLVFPFISKSIFTKTLDSAYGPRNLAGSACAKACVYAFLAIVSLFGVDEGNIGAGNSKSYALAAEACVPQILHESSAEGLQALVMLIQYHYFIGDLSSAETLIAAASRLAYALEAHVHPGPPVYRKDILECHLRDLFWLCYSFDRDMALRTGQPPTINDDHCDLTLPMGYEDRQNPNILSDGISIDEFTLPLYPWDPRLSRIKSSTYNGLYSASARRKTQPEILECIRTLDEALEQWRQSLHPDFRPTLSFSPETPVNARINTQAVMLRLAYYHCVAMIHRAVVKCRELPSSPHNLSGRVESSLGLCVDASRSTLTYLRKALPVVEDECFWVVLFYPITAIMVIFSNVLENPLSSSATNDLDILSEVPVLIRQTPIRELTIAEMIHLESLVDLTAELTKLGRLAHDKARLAIDSS